MAVTRSRAAERPEIRGTAGSTGRHIRPRWRTRELAWMLGAGILVAIGLYFVNSAKAPELADARQQLAARNLLNLNELNAREDLLPALGSTIPTQREREEAARRIYDLSGGLPNVGRIRPVLTGEQFRELKPAFVVRRPAQFRRAFQLWTLLFFGAFLGAH